MFGADKFASIFRKNETGILMSKGHLMIYSLKRKKTKGSVIFVDTAALNGCYL